MRQISNSLTEKCNWDILLKEPDQANVDLPSISGTVDDTMSNFLLKWRSVTEFPLKMRVIVRGIAWKTILKAVAAGSTLSAVETGSDWPDICTQHFYRIISCGLEYLFFFPLRFTGSPIHGAEGSQPLQEKRMSLFIDGKLPGSVVTGRSGQSFMENLEQVKELKGHNSPLD